MMSIYLLLAFYASIASVAANIYSFLPIPSPVVNSPGVGMSSSAIMIQTWPYDASHLAGCYSSNPHQFYFRQGTCVCPQDTSACFIFFCVDPSTIYVELYGDTTTTCQSSAFVGNAVMSNFASCLATSIHSHTFNSMRAGCFDPTTIPQPTPQPTIAPGTSARIIQMEVYQSTSCFNQPQSTLMLTQLMPQNACISPFTIGQSVSVACVTNTSTFVAFYSDSACIYPGDFQLTFSNGGCYETRDFFGGFAGYSFYASCIDPPVLPDPPAELAHYFINGTFTAYDSNTRTCGAVVEYDTPLLMLQGECFSASSTKSIRASCAAGGKVNFITYDDLACKFIYGQAAIGDTAVAAETCIQVSATVGLKISCESPAQIPTFTPSTFAPVAGNTAAPIVVPAHFGAYAIDYNVYDSSCSEAVFNDYTNSMSQLQCVKISDILSFHAFLLDRNTLTVQLFADGICYEVDGIFNTQADVCYSMPNGHKYLFHPDLRPDLTAANADPGHSWYKVAYQQFQATDTFCGNAAGPEVAVSQGVCSQAIGVGMTMTCDIHGNVWWRQTAADCTTFYAESSEVGVTIDECIYIPSSNTRFKFACTTLVHGVLPDLVNRSATTTQAPYDFGSDQTGTVWSELTTGQMLMYILPGVALLLCLPFMLCLGRRYKHKIADWLKRRYEQVQPTSAPAAVASGDVPITVVQTNNNKKRGKFWQLFKN